ncbi:hypothetical protein D5S17_17210 [Pseudonocardiaceae bacterium YIM PH 21723]|nr:hypothetical protein D5S17_17210 [Pseudonocardiaceae bacterium YIM PH 21723]
MRLAFGSDIEQRAALDVLITAAQTGIHPLWTLVGALPWPPRTVQHLPPPAAADGAAATMALRNWRAGYRPGSCHYRVGPGFVLITDERPGGDRLRITITGEWLPAFEQIRDGLPCSGREAAQLLAELVEVGLALSFGELGQVLLVPRVARLSFSAPPGPG